MMPFDPIENVWAEREIDALVEARRLKDAAEGRERRERVRPDGSIAIESVPIAAFGSIPSEFRQAVSQDETVLAIAEARARMAEQSTRARIGREGPSDQLAKLWLEEALLEPNRIAQAAKDKLNTSRLLLGAVVEAKRRLDQIEKTMAARRKAEEERYQKALEALDNERAQARKHYEQLCGGRK